MYTTLKDALVGDFLKRGITTPVTVIKKDYVEVFRCWIATVQCDALISNTKTTTVMYKFDD